MTFHWVKRLWQIETAITNWQCVPVEFIKPPIYTLHFLAVCVVTEQRRYATDRETVFPPSHSYRDPFLPLFPPLLSISSLAVSLIIRCREGQCGLMSTRGLERTERNRCRPLAPFRIFHGWFGQTVLRNVRFELYFDTADNLAVSSADMSNKAIADLQ